MSLNGKNGYYELFVSRGARAVSEKIAEDEYYWLQVGS